MASLQARIMMSFLKRLSRRALQLMDNLELLRKEKDRILSKVPVPKGVQVLPFLMGNLASATFMPPASRYLNKVVLYLHGGGYVTGSYHSHSGLIGKLALQLGMPVVAVNYRLAPENPYPAALDDAIAAYKWLIEKERYRPQDIIIAGDSAGGGLALATLLKIRDTPKLESPLAAIVLSPWTDLSVEGESARTEPERDPLLTVPYAKKWGKWYAGDKGVEHPYVSPANADLHDLPPILIHVGTEEILLSDSVNFSMKAVYTNTEVQLEIFDDMPHVFHFFWQYLPEAREAMQKIVAFVDEKVPEEEKMKALKVKSSKTLFHRTSRWAKLSVETLKIGRDSLKKKLGIE